MELTGKVALVTGAGSGIGKAAAVLLAQQGARVAALSRTAHEVERTAAEIERDGKEAIALVADIAQEDQMQRAVQQMLDRWGRIDIVFANAGINGMWAPIEELSLAEWSQTITINLTGTFLTIKYTVPHLSKQPSFSCSWYRILLERRSRNGKDEVDRKSQGWLAQEKRTCEEKEHATIALAATSRAFSARRADCEKDSQSQIVCVFASPPAEGGLPSLHSRVEQYASPSPSGDRVTDSK